VVHGNYLDHEEIELAARLKDRLSVVYCPRTHDYFAHQPHPLTRLLDAGVLTRFGPMFNAEALGGAVTLAAMAVPPERFEAVAEMVNGRREVAHNYARDHALNMWFVIATDQPQDIAGVIAGIAADSGLAVYNFPKQEEFFIGFKVDA